jgi:asparaginyl-tRNA synthetase
MSALSSFAGAGEQFVCTTLLPEHAKPGQIPVDKAGHVDFSKDFFGRRCCLTVSGQLNVETHACARSDVYTFGPTFRAENSHTARHLAEFWMIEPEICFADLSDDMALAEDYVRYARTHARTQARAVVTLGESV